MSTSAVSTLELRAIDTVLEMGGGYVLDFTDRTFAEFFRDHGVQIDDPKYSVPGWMGLPKDTDVTGATRPNIEHYPAGVRADLGEVLNQDVDLVEAVQRGQKSRGFRGPLWSEQEIRLRHYHREIDRYLRGEK